MGLLKGRNRSLRRAAIAAATVIFTISVHPSAAYAGNWRYDESGQSWRFYKNDGSFLTSRWFQDEDGGWYYLDHDGNMLTDAVTPDGYTVKKDGMWDQKVEQIAMYPYIVPDESCNHRVGKYGEPIFQVDTEEPLIALSFDSGSDFDYTDELLAILEKYKIRSTFFLTRDWMDSHEDQVRRIYDHGHEIGNHSIDHPDFTKLSAEQMAVQIQETHQRIKELTGRDAFLFRAPFGAYNMAVVDAIKANGYYSIQWTVDSLDWKNLGVQPVLDRVLNSEKLKNGAIVLMHNGATYTPQALETIIQEILNRGYQIVPVSELIYTRDYRIDGNGTQHSTKPAEAAGQEETAGQTEAAEQTAGQAEKTADQDEKTVDQVETAKQEKKTGPAKTAGQTEKTGPAKTTEPAAD